MSYNYYNSNLSGSTNSGVWNYSSGYHSDDRFNSRQSGSSRYGSSSSSLDYGRGGSNQYSSAALQGRIKDRLGSYSDAPSGRTTSVLCLFRNAPNSEVQRFDDDEETKKWFFQYDRVLRIDVNVSRSSASVKFKTPEGAARAVKGLHNKVVRSNGAILKVRYLYEDPSTRSIKSSQYTSIQLKPKATLSPKKTPEKKTTTTAPPSKEQLKVIECPKEALYCYVCDRATFNNATAYASHLIKPKHKEARALLSAKNRAVEKLLQAAAELADKQVSIRLQNVIHQIGVLESEIGGTEKHPKKTKLDRLKKQKETLQTEKTPERLAYEKFQEDSVCATCNYLGENPIDFENHMCSLEHLKAAYDDGVNPKQTEKAGKDFDSALIEIIDAKENAEMCPISLYNPPSYDEKEAFGLEFFEHAKVFNCTTCDAIVKPGNVHAHSKTLTHFKNVMDHFKAVEMQKKLAKKGKKKGVAGDVSITDEPNEQLKGEHVEGADEENLKGELDETEMFHDFILNEAEEAASEGEAQGNHEEFASMLEDIAEDYVVEDVSEERNKSLNVNGEEDNHENLQEVKQDVDSVSPAKGRGRKRKVTEESVDSKDSKKDQHVASPRKGARKVKEDAVEEPEPTRRVRVTRRTK